MRGEVAGLAGGPVGEDVGRYYNQAEQVDGIDAGDAAECVALGRGSRPAGGGVAAGEHKAAEHEEGGDGLITAADESEESVGKKQDGSFEFLAGSSEVVEDDPEGEEEAESGEGWKVPAQGFPDGRWR